MGGVLIWIEATAASMYLSIVSLDTRALARSNLPSTRMSQDHPVSLGFLGLELCGDVEGRYQPRSLTMWYLVILWSFSGV